MPVNQILPFATGTGANVMLPADYEALPALPTGFGAGIASSQQLNTVWRQSSVVAAMIAKFIVDQTGGDVLDDGDVTGLETKFVAALDALISPELLALSGAIEAEASARTTADGLLAPKSSPVLTGTPTAPTPTTGDKTTKLATTAFVKTAIDAIPSGVAPQAGSQAADISTGSTPSVTTYTCSILPVAGLLHVTAFFNSGGVAAYNFHSTLAVTGTGVAGGDESLSTTSVISHGHTLCISVAAGASPVVSLSVTSDSPSAGQVRLSYLYIPI